MASLGKAELEVTLNTTGLTNSLNQAKGDAARALTGMERQAQNSADRVANAFEKGVRESGKQLESLAERAGNAFGAIATPTGVAIAALGGLGLAARSSVNTFADFEQQMKGVQAVLGGTQQEYDALKDAALDAGAQTKFSATEAAAAIEELAKQGLSASEIMGGGLKGTTDLAAAAGIGLADAASIATVAMKAFNLEASDLPGIADTISAAANSSALDVADLGQALQALGPTGRDAGLSFEEVSAALAKMADNGIRGSDAGTSLKTMLAGLTPNTDKAKKAFAELNVEVFDSEGNYRKFGEIVAQMRPALSNLTQQQRAVALETIFGSDATRAASIIFGTTGKSIADYTDQVSKSGEASKNAATRQDSLRSSQEELKGSAETLSIKFGEFLSPALKTATDLATNFLNALNDGEPIVVTFTTAIGTLVSIIAVNGLLSAVRTFITLAPAMGAAFGIAFGPVGWIITGVAALTAGLIALLGQVRQAKSELAQNMDGLKGALDPKNTASGGGFAGNNMQGASGGGRSGTSAPKPTVQVQLTDPLKEAVNEAKRLQAALEKATSFKEWKAATDALEAFRKASGTNAQALTYLNGLTKEAAKNAKDYTSSLNSAEDKAKSFADRLADLTGGFRDSLATGKVSASQVESYALSLKGLVRDAEQAGVKLPAAALASARGLIAQGEAAAKSARALEDAAAKARAWGDNLKAIAYDKYRAGLTDYTDAQLKSALANAIAAKDVQKYNDVLAEQKNRHEAAKKAADDYQQSVVDLAVLTARVDLEVKQQQQAAIDAGNIVSLKIRAERFAQNLLDDIAAAIGQGNPTKIKAQLDRLRGFIASEWFSRLPVDIQRVLTAQEEPTAQALLAFGDRMYSRLDSRTADNARKAQEAAEKRGKGIAQSLTDAVASKLPADLSAAIAEGTSLVTSDDFKKLPESLQAAIKAGLDAASKDYEEWAKSLGSGVAVPYGKADPATMGSEIYQAAKRAAISAKAALEAGTLTGETFAAFSDDVQRAVTAAGAVPGLFTPQQIADIKAYAANLTEIGDTLTRIKANDYAPGQAPKTPAPTQEELDRAERLAWLNNTTKYYSPPPKPEMLTEEDLARLERLETIEGHIKYAGLGTTPTWALAADDALQAMADDLEEIAGFAGTEVPLALGEVERKLLAISQLDLSNLSPFTEEGAANLMAAKDNVSFLEGVISGSADAETKAVAQELLDIYKEALAVAERLGWAEGSIRYAPNAAPVEELGRRNRPKLEGGLGERRNPAARNARDDLNLVREGYDLGTVSADEYRAALERTIASLEASGLKTLEARNAVAVLRAELDTLNNSALTKSLDLFRQIGGSLSGIGSAINSAFGESADGATKLFNAMGLIASTVPSLVQSFNLLATATGSAFNTALGWIGLVLSAIQFVLNLIGVFRSKTKEEDAPKIDTNAGFAFGMPDTGKSPSIALNAPSASGFSYGAGTIQAANVMQQAAGVMLQAGQLQLQAALALAGKAGISTGPTNALAWGV